jgi:hypothetical protein
VQTIVWDIDDVLNGLMRAWFEQRWRPAHPGSSVSYEDLKQNPPCQALGMGMAAYLASLDEFRLSPQGRNLAPNRDVLAWLELNGAAYRHVALTARPMETAPQAAEWLFRHFGRHFRCFGVVPSRSETAAPVYDRHKGDFLEWLGKADFFVDDSQENVTLAAALGVKSILYPQPWNRSRETVSDVLRSLTPSNRMPNQRGTDASVCQPAALGDCSPDRSSVLKPVGSVRGSFPALLPLNPAKFSNYQTRR